MNDLRQKVIVNVMRRMHRWTRALTMGARVAVFDPQGSVLLVRHTYLPGWIFPGGGVEFGETTVDAAIREIREEAGIIALEEPKMFGFYANHKNFPGDHLAFFTLRRFDREKWQPSSEIAAAEFFSPQALPESTTGGTRRRLVEILDHGKPDHHW